MSKYCVQLLTFPPSILMTWHAGNSIRLFDGGMVPVAVCSGPVCVPFQTTSMMAVSPLRVLADERRLGVRNRLGPPLPHLENLADALYPPARGLLIVDAVLGERRFQCAPILFVVCGRGGLCGLEDA
jgi:hypothetical protein